MRTGECCERTAIYRSGCPCVAKVTIALGAKAPVCPICLRACNWVLGPEATRGAGRFLTRSVATRRQSPRA